MLHDSIKKPNYGFAYHFQYLLILRGGRANIHTADCHQGAAATCMESSELVIDPFQVLSTFIMVSLNFLAFSRFHSSHLS